MTCLGDAGAVAGPAAAAAAAAKLVPVDAGGFGKDLLRSLVSLVVAACLAQVTKDQEQCALTVQPNLAIGG